MIHEIYSSIRYFSAYSLDDICYHWILYPFSTNVKKFGHWLQCLFIFLPAIHNFMYIIYSSSPNILNRLNSKGVIKKSAMSADSIPDTANIPMKK